MSFSRQSVKWAVTAIAVVTTLMVASATAQAGPVLYVDDNAPLGGDGGSWDTAYRFLQDALAFAADPANRITEIRVGRGIYKPDQDEGGNVTPGDRAATFELLNGVALRGGYAGLGAPDPDAHDIELYETILSGDLWGNDLPTDDVVHPSLTDNIFHVLTANGVDASTVLDGFAVTGGVAGFDAPLTQRLGGGLLCNGGGPTLNGCTFTANLALQGGAIAFLMNAHPELTDCIVTDNAASTGGGIYVPVGSIVLSECTVSNNSGGAGEGGGIFLSVGSLTANNCLFTGNFVTENRGGAVFTVGAAVSMVDCTFSGNSAPSGAGMYNTGSSSVVNLIGCHFSNNTAGNGAGLYINIMDSGDATLTYCVFQANSASINGGGIFNDDGPPVLTQCLFTGNTAGNLGGAIYNFLSVDSGYPMVTNCTFTGNSASGIGGAIYNNFSSPTVTDCILWGNIGPGGADQAAQIGGGFPIVNYSCIQGLTGSWRGTGNIGTDPLFVDSPNGDLHLSPGSPCIDAGDNTAVPKGIVTDLDGNLRFVDDPDSRDSGVGDCPIVDMGAYEFQDGTRTCACPADLDGDGFVGILDLLALLAAWSTDPGGPPDFDGDGTVGILDLLTLLANWGPCP